MLLSVGMKLVLEPLLRQNSSEQLKGIGKENSGRMCMICHFFSPILKRNTVFQVTGTCCGPNQLLMIPRRLLANGVYTIYSSSDTPSTLYNFVIRSSFSAKPGRIFPFPFLCFLCLISFASLCLLKHVSL